MDLEFAKVDTKASFVEELQTVRHKIAMSSKLETPDKNNLIVDLNVAEWEQSRSRKI